MSGTKWLLLACLVLPCACGIGYQRLPYSCRRGDFDSFSDERPFDRIAWLNKTTTDECGRRGPCYLRAMMLDDIDVMNMNQAQIKALLGPPDGHRQLKDGLGLWEYELGNWTVSTGNYYTIIFNGDRVQATNANERFIE